MPRIDFAPEFRKPTTNYDFPKLKLKKDEQARILVIEEQPMVEFVHTIRKPKVVMGKPVMETKKRRDGTEYQDYSMDFLSRPICLGDFGVLQDKGSDPKNCPVCALAAESSDMAQDPQRRFAIHVIKYKTKPGSTKVAVPFSVELVVWSFTDRTYAKLDDFREEWGNLRQHDVTLNCTNEPFQLYDINISPTAEWMLDDERQALVKATYRENQIPDLSIACGSRKDKRWIDEDLGKVRSAWAEIAGSQASKVENLDEALTSVFASVKTAAPVTPDTFSVSNEKAPFDLDDEPAAPAAPAPRAVTSPVSTEEKSLEDLLADLDDD